MRSVWLVIIGLSLVALPPTPAAATGCESLSEESVLTLDGTVHPVDAVVALRTLILVWSAYDPQSRRSIRELDAWWAKQRDTAPGTVVIALASLEYREPPSSVQAVVKKAGVDLPVFVDGRGTVTQALATCAGVGVSLPSVFAVTGSGDDRGVERIVGSWNDRATDRLERWLSAEPRRRSGGSK